LLNLPKNSRGVDDESARPAFSFKASPHVRALMSGEAVAFTDVKPDETLTI